MSSLIVNFEDSGKQAGSNRSRHVKSTRQALLPACIIAEVSTIAPAPLDEAAIIRALQASKSEAAAGRTAESDQLLAQLARQAPNHPAVLNELGVRMLARGAPDQAQALFTRATTADPRHPTLWANLASSFKQLGRRPEEINAIEKALALEPRHVSALLQKGAYLEDMGDPRNAARTYQNVLDCVPPGAEVPPNIKDALAHAKSTVDADRAALALALEEPLAQIRERHGGARQHRVDQCLDTLMGKRRTYHSQPTWMYFPELPAIEFFDRSYFPWLDALEAASAEIRSELLRVLVADREGLQPYIDFREGLPIDQFRELNRSRRWSAYFLWNQSEPVAGHIARCPVTSRTLEAIPRCRVARRAPTAFFFDSRSRHAHSAAHRHHQHAVDRASAVDRAPTVRISRRRDDARVGAGTGVGVRRYHRARSLELIGYAARHSDLRHLESAVERRGARHDPDRHRDLWAVLLAASRG